MDILQKVSSRKMFADHPQDFGNSAIRGIVLCRQTIGLFNATVFCIFTLAFGVRFGAADTLLVDSGSLGVDGEPQIGDLGLSNESRIVGMQFDIVFPPTEVEGITPRSSGELPGHSIASRAIADDRIRVVVHSLRNIELPSGELLEFPVRPSAGVSKATKLTVENVIFTNENGDNIPSTIATPQHPLDDWRKDSFTLEQLEDPLIVGDRSDPDGDGIANIFEFLYGTNPLGADDHSIVSRTFGLEPGRETAVLSFDYPQAKGRSGAELIVESSSDLVTWRREVGMTVPTGEETDLTRRMRLVVRSPLAGTPVKFYRITVVRVGADEGIDDQASFVEWTERHHLAGGDAEELADPDKDGLNNFLEYFFGSDPAETSDSPLPTTAVIVGDAGARFVKLSRPRSVAREGVTLSVASTSPVQVWRPQHPEGRADGVGKSEIEMLVEHSVVADSLNYRFQVRRP